MTIMAAQVLVFHIRKEGIFSYVILSISVAHQIGHAQPDKYYLQLVCK